MIPRTADDPAATATAYAALRTSAVLVDRSSRARATFGAPKAAEVLTGLVTNDILALHDGTGCYAAALTPKGKIIADARLFVRANDILVDVAPAAAAGWWAMVRKFVNPRLSRFADVSDSLADLSVYGAEAASIVSQAAGVERDRLRDLQEFEHLTVPILGADCTVARVPDLGVEGFAIFVPVERRDAAKKALQLAGAVPAPHATVEIARIESGRAEWGVEMDENTLPQEANLEELHAISYTKGCYTGQETVARIHFRGHVNRRLRGMRFHAGGGIPVRGEVFDASGKSVGEVRSVAHSPRLGGIGIAMIRREVAPGSEVEIRAADGSAKALVVDLPMTDD